MHALSSHIVSVDLIETYGSMPSGPMHNQGLDQNADLKQKHITMQRTLDLIKEEIKSYPSSSLLSYIQPFEFKCRVSENGMSKILCTIACYEINIVPCFEIEHVLPCRSTVLSLSSFEYEEVPSFFENSEGSFTHEAMEDKMINGRHLDMRNLFSFLDDTFSMSISQLKERLLPTADPKPHWFWKAMDEKKVSLRDLIGGALQHFMRCKVLH